jgi:hypothetical protein
MKRKAPTTAGTVIGAESAQPKPNGLLNPLIRLQAALLKENRNDLPQLPDRM